MKLLNKFIKIVDFIVDKQPQFFVIQLVTKKVIEKWFFDRANKVEQLRSLLCSGKGFVGCNRMGMQLETFILGHVHKGCRDKFEGFGGVNTPQKILS